MLDYKLWMNNAENFVSVLSSRFRGANDRAEMDFFDPPLNLAERQRLEAELSLPLPDELRVFLATASSRFSFRYVWSNLTPAEKEAVEQIYPGESYLYGGADLCPAWEMAGHLDSCREWGEETWIDEFETEQDKWLHAFPFAHLENGDYLAISLREENCRPVIYLSHDDESHILSPSFDEFLQTWERLCYVGPEIWLLEPFRDPMTGYLSHKIGNATLLRQLFEVEN